MALAFGDGTVVMSDKCRKSRPKVPLPNARVRHPEAVARVAGVILFVDAFVLLDGFVRARLYQGEPRNPNFRPGFAINRFRGKWELRLGIPVAAIAGTVLLIAIVAG